MHYEQTKKPHSVSRFLHRRFNRRHIQFYKIVFFIWSQDASGQIKGHAIKQRVLFLVSAQKASSLVLSNDPAEVLWITLRIRTVIVLFTHHFLPNWVKYFISYKIHIQRFLSHNETTPYLTTSYYAARRINKKSVKKLSS